MKNDEIKLSASNFLFYALNSYTNTNIVDIEEFNDDIKRFKYLRKLLNKYRKSGDIQIHLVINHFIVSFNVFTPKECTKMMMFKLADHLDIVKPILVFLNRWPNSTVDGIDGLKPFKGSDIKSDEKIVTLIKERYKTNEKF